MLFLFLFFFSSLVVPFLFSHNNKSGFFYGSVLVMGIFLVYEWRHAHFILFRYEWRHAHFMFKKLLISISLSLTYTHT